MRTRHLVLREAVLVAVVGAIQIGITILAAQNQPERVDLGPGAIALLLTGAAVLPLRRRWPVAVLGITFTVTLAYISLGYPQGPVYLSLIIGLAAVVLAGRRRVAIAVLVAGYIGFPWLGFLIGRTDRPPVAELVALAAWLITLLSVIEVVRSRRDRAAEEARGHEEALRRRASDERLRIAQELHDVVAHNMSLINIQAGVALHLIDEQPDQVRSALTTIKGASKDALVELRSILGILRQVDEDAPRAPTSGLEDLDRVVASAGSAGIDVRVEVDDGIDLADLPRPVDLAAFRIIQESLTNVARHSPGSPALVRLGRTDGMLAVEVLDEGCGRPPLAGVPGGGNGIPGMRERASSVGGHLDAGPRPGRGFAVRARLPVEEPS